MSDEETHAGSAGGASSPALQYPPTSSGLDSDMNDVVSTTNGGITRPNRHPSSNVNLRNPFSADVSQSQSGRDPLSSQISAIGPNTSSGGNALNLLLMHDQQTPPLTMTDFPSSLGSSNAILHDQGTPHQ